MQSTFEKAQRDLDEAMNISERGGMGLFQADCHLGYARLYLARGDKEKARKNWDREGDDTEDGVSQAGWGVEELEEKLGKL